MREGGGDVFVCLCVDPEQRVHFIAWLYLRSEKRRGVCVVQRARCTGVCQVLQNSPTARGQEVLGLKRKLRSVFSVFQCVSVCVSVCLCVSVVSEESL